MMGKVVAVMNTKGGVGKSTTVMMVAEALAMNARIGNPQILIIDADAQSSISNMMVSTDIYKKLEAEAHTLYEYMVQCFNARTAINPDEYIKPCVSDVIGATTISLLPNRIEFSLLERMIMPSGAHAIDLIHKTVQGLIQNVRSTYDLVLIDCAPGNSVINEAFLSSSDYYLAPVRPDYLALRGLQVLQVLKDRMRMGSGMSPSLPVPENIGTLITMRPQGTVAAHFVSLITSNNGYRPFPLVIGHVAAAANAAQPLPAGGLRGFTAKYGAALSGTVQLIAHEFWQRLNGKGDGNVG